MGRPIRKLRLLAAPTVNKMTSVGGKISIEGLDDITKNNITSLNQIKYRAEVVQIVDVGINSYTPAGGTKYTVAIGDPARTRNGARDIFRYYHYTTPSDVTTIGATAALQREAIHVKLISQINQDSTNFCVAATKTGGAGIRITDDAGYYPARQPNSLTGRLGANKIFCVANTDGSGWGTSMDGGSGNNDSVITAAVYAYGVGATLLAQAPVFDPMHGNIISGNYEAPKTIDNLFATSGQKYDAFSISSLKAVPGHNIVPQLAYELQEQVIYADNGTGTSTAQLTGYLAFEREMLKLMTDLYAVDARTIRDFYDTPILFQGPVLGQLPVTTDTAEQKIMTGYGSYLYVNIGTQTIVSPAGNASGLILDQDLTTTEGAEYVPASTLQNQKKFIVGNQGFSVFARIKHGDCTDMSFLLGFHEEGAISPDYNDYNDLGAIGNIGDLIETAGILQNAATVLTNTTVVPADATWFDLEVRVAVDGTVTAYYNNVAYPVYSAGTTVLVLVAGTVMVPFFRAVNIGGGDPDTIVNMWFSVGTDAWRY